MPRIEEQAHRGIFYKSSELFLLLSISVIYLYKFLHISISIYWKIASSLLNTTNTFSGYLVSLPQL